MNEEFKYFISFRWADGDYDNIELNSTYINGIEDIRNLQKYIQKHFASDVTCIIINYRMF